MKRNKTVIGFAAKPASPQPEVGDILVHKDGDVYLCAFHPSRPGERRLYSMNTGRLWSSDSLFGDYFAAPAELFRRLDPCDTITITVHEERS